MGTGVMIGAGIFCSGPDQIADLAGTWFPSGIFCCGHRSLSSVLIRYVNLC